MSDIKLFRISGNAVSQVEGQSVAVERSLQTLLENHLETFLGVRLIKSEHTTGKSHGGRIDTLGIDENESPVIIEYKRSLGNQPVKSYQREVEKSWQNRARRDPHHEEIKVFRKPDREHTEGSRSRYITGRACSSAWV